jgi:hypothetical protein
MKSFEFHIQNCIKGPVLIEYLRVHSDMFTY